MATDQAGTREGEERAEMPVAQATTVRLRPAEVASEGGVRVPVAPSEAANDVGDPRVARALRAMSERIDGPWTVASLARTVGMSRAAFARLFTGAVGVPPLRHLAELRMREAARRLATGDDGLAALAATLGYATEFSFSRAFKRHAGVAPAIYRRRVREQAPRRGFTTMARAA